MNVTDTKLKQLNDPNLTLDQRALLRCRLAGEFIHTGQYEAAREVLSYLWQGIGERPELQGLASATAAEVLLQCGVLSGWLGSVQQIPNAQEKAKDLLSEALRIFESQSQQLKVSEVLYELGMCYWRLGAYDEARVNLSEALKPLTKSDIELKAKILIRRTVIEIWENRYYEALSVLKEAEQDFESANDALKGRWHGQMAIVLVRVGNVEGNADYYDRAIIQFTASIYHYEQAKHERYSATNLNNLAMTLNMLGRYEEAHENLDRAQRIYERLRDSGNLAQVNETRARVLIAEHRYDEASRIIASVIQAFEKGGEHALLADALAVQGIALARLGEHDRSLPILRHAINLAEDSGSFVGAGLAALTLIEEHGTTRLSEYELYNVYRRADELLKDTQDYKDIKRLRMCARVVMRRLSGVRLSDKGFTLTKAVRDFESLFIEQALELEQGSITRAARRLGIKHQLLDSLLQTRHQKLQSKRTPRIPRKRSIIKDE